MTAFVDVLINNNDLVLSSQGEPLLISDRPSIAQDIVHLCRESRLLTLMIGAREPWMRQARRNELEIAIEEQEERVIPGSVAISEQQDIEQLLLTADTYDYGAIRVLFPIKGVANA